MIINEKSSFLSQMTLRNNLEGVMLEGVMLEGVMPMRL
jgi:hypothetical protein